MEGFICVKLYLFSIADRPTKITVKQRTKLIHCYRFIFDSFSNDNKTQIHSV